MTGDNNYLGDAAWFDFINSIKPLWNSCLRKADLIAALGRNENLAIAANFAAGQHSLEWVERPVPALGMRTPRSFAASPESRNILSRNNSISHR